MQSDTQFQLLLFYISNNQCILNNPKPNNMTKNLVLASCLLMGISVMYSCNNAGTSLPVAEKSSAETDTLEYFNLRPKLEKEYGYTHAVRIGNDLKISGAVSMNDSGMIVAPGNMEQQMKNCYSDLEKILQHYGYTYDDVVVENIYKVYQSERSDDDGCKGIY